MQIAFADDHALIRDGLRPFLRKLSDDVSLIEAETFGGVIERMEKSDIQTDLCILDLRMPDMDPMSGLDAVTRAFPNTRVAVLTSITDPRTVKEALQKGVCGYIPKRLSADAIMSALRLVMAGETFVPSLMLNGSSGAHRSGADDLTSRERQVMALLRDGMSNKGIARRLNISEVTVKTHLTSAFRKLDVQNRVQAARIWHTQVD